MYTEMVLKSGKMYAPMFPIATPPLPEPVIKTAHEKNNQLTSTVAPSTKSSKQKEPIGIQL